ncbi:MAG: OsmC family protein [Chloroflexota bacterium]
MLTTNGNIASPLEPRSITEPVDPAPYPAIARLTMPDAPTTRAFIALTPSSHTLTIDIDANYGGNNSGPEPKELLLVSLGTCTGEDVISILRKKRQRVTQYNINVYATEAEEHPRIYTSILVEHVVSGYSVDPIAVARSIELSITKYCPVHALLSRATHVEHVYRVLEEAAPLETGA